jgi:hypothetical protein
MNIIKYFRKLNVLNKTVVDMKKELLHKEKLLSDVKSVCNKNKMFRCDPDCFYVKKFDEVSDELDSLIGRCDFICKKTSVLRICLKWILNTFLSILIVYFILTGFTENWQKTVGAVAVSYYCVTGTINTVNFLSQKNRKSK